MSQLFVVAKLVGKPGTGDELKGVLSALVPTVRMEDGCVRYDLHRSKRDPEEFLFYEVWRDKEALGAHAKADHMMALHEQIKDLVTGPTEVSMYSAVDVS